MTLFGAQQILAMQFSARSESFNRKLATLTALADTYDIESQCVCGQTVNTAGNCVNHFVNGAVHSLGRQLD